MKVVIIDYGAGNVFSVTTALQRLGVQAVLSSDVRLIVRADRVISVSYTHLTLPTNREE